MMKVLLWLWTASISSSYCFRFSLPVSHFKPLSVSADWKVEGVAVAPLTTTTDDKRDVFDEYYSACMVASENNMDRGDILRRSNHLGRTLLAGMKRPHVRDEAWRHTSLRRLFSHVFSRPLPTIADNGPTAHDVHPFIDDSCRDSYLVFIDGQFRQELSNVSGLSAGVIASSLLSLSGSCEWQQKQRFVDMIESVPDSHQLPRNSFGSDVLTAINLAQLDDAACIYVPKDTVQEAPLQILFCNTEDAQDSFSSSPRLLALVDDGSSLRLKQSFATISNGALNNATSGASLVISNTALRLGTNARLDHTYAQDLSIRSRHLEVISASVGGNASYDVTVLQTGASIARVNIHVNLTEVGANCSLSGVSLAGDKQSLDMHSNILHDARACTSRQQQRNVIADRGEAIFKGRIQIPKHAQLTDSDQLCRSIMLGKRARIIAMPTLEITADNIVCSHGASVTDLDENSMFYLAARGIDRQEARKLLLRGFVFDLLQDRVVDARTARRVVDKLDEMYALGDGGPVDSVQKFVSM